MPNGKLVYLLHTLVSSLLLLIIDYWLLNENRFYTSYNNQFGEEVAIHLLEQTRKWKWVGYLLVPVINFIKFLLISIVIKIGTTLNRIEIGLGQIFTSTVLADFVFVIALIVKIFYFLNLDSFDLKHYMFFYPLSLAHFWNGEDYPYWINVFQTISLFGIAFIYVLSWALNNYVSRGIKKWLKLNFQYYGTSLIFWLVLVSYLTMII